MKKYLKAFFVIILSAVVLFSALPAMRADAANVKAQGKCGTNLKWKFYDDGKLVVSGSGKMDDYENCAAAPWSKYKEDILEVEIEKGVTSIGECAFYLECVNIEKVSIADTVTSIGAFAFGCCRKLEDVTIPDSVITIGDKAFVMCDKFETLTIPTSVNSLGKYAFSACSELKEVTFKGTVPEIPDGLFNGCIHLRILNIPDGVTAIGAKAFASCWDLYAVTIPDSVLSIGEEAFSDNTMLRYICYTGTKEQWGKIVIDDPDGEMGESYFDGLGSLLKYEQSFVPFTEAVFKETEISVPVGEKIELELVVVPKNHTEPVLWGWKGNNHIDFKLDSSDNRDSQTFTGLKPGNYTIVAYCGIHYGKNSIYRNEYLCTITVTEAVNDKADTDETDTDTGKSDTDKSDKGKSEETDIASDKTDTDKDIKTDSNPDYIEGLNLDWNVVDGKYYWFENGYKQGTLNDPKGVMGTDPESGIATNRGREICDNKIPDANGNGSWFWLDSVYGGAKATNKEVWMPYIYQDEANWSDEEIERIAAESDGGMEGMGRCVLDAIKNKDGKWVAYDDEGRMLKGWVTVSGKYLDIYREDQAGNCYYYDTRTGLMAKGWVMLNGMKFHFDEVTGVLY